MNQNQAEKNRRERYVAQKFCERLGDGCQLLNAERESPDCLISLNDQNIGVELARIRNSTSYDKWIDSFRKFQKYIHKQSSGDDSAKGFISVWSRAEPLRQKKGQARWKCPNKEDYEQCYLELKKLANENLLDIGQTQRQVYFKEDYSEQHPAQNTFPPGDWPNCEEISGEDYPLIYKYFSGIDLWGGEASLTVQHSYDQEIKLGEPEMRRVIEDKIKKLPTYRSNLKSDGVDSVKLWLLLYAEGFEPSRSIPHKWESCTERIKEIYCKEVARSSINGFDEFWLGTDVMLGDSLIEGRPPSTSFQRLV